jgi:hypothetical protein
LPSKNIAIRSTVVDILLKVSVTRLLFNLLQINEDAPRTAHLMPATGELELASSEDIPPGFPAVQRHVKCRPFDVRWNLIWIKVNKTAFGYPHTIRRTASSE